MSCEGIQDERICGLADSFVFCEQFLEWSNWEDWKDEQNSQKQVSRPRWGKFALQN